MNVHVEEKESLCINWDSVKEWDELLYPENAALLTVDQKMSQNVVDARER